MRVEVKIDEQYKELMVWIKKFDLSLNGTVCIYFKDGTNTFVSRRYVKKVKSKLGV
ncbi:MAG: LytTR family transcriptional regulator DNA-binding domain-containing protein [bacterium]|nr:LytTR family transcriptional regulator DNA-binding domain-containing protein [bacterium]